MKRPISITIIAWVLLISGLSAAACSVWAISAIHNPTTVELFKKQSMLPISVQFFIMILGAINSFICSIAMFKAKNWSRYLYLIANIVMYSVTFATSNTRMMILPGMFLVIIIIAFLFHLKANVFFKENAAPKGYLCKSKI